MSHQATGVRSREMTEEGPHSILWGEKVQERQALGCSKWTSFTTMKKDLETGDQIQCARYNGFPFCL